MKATIPIDAVIAWVDGSDPVHKAKRAAALQKLREKSDLPIAAGIANTRFHDNGELRYCIASIKKFAPWIRTIYIITDNQVPRFRNENFLQGLDIRIVDHKDIFRSYEWALPTFNSITIETAMWRVPELSERFIYFNDDFLITRAVVPEDFFQGDKVVLRGCWKRQRKYGTVTIYANIIINFLLRTIFGINRTMYLLAQMRGSQTAGCKNRYYRFPHVPHPIHTETLKCFFERHPDVFTNNIRYPFRDMHQFLSVSLANHLEISSNKAILQDQGGVKMISGEKDTAKKIRRTLRDIQAGAVTCLCLESLEAVESDLRNEIDQCLSRLLDL